MTHSLADMPFDIGRTAGSPSPEEARGKDLLTGLTTRAGLIEELNAMLRGSDKHRESPALILLDLDRFKTFNDRLGPLVCDKVLCRVAKRLKSTVPDAAIIARVSGDGFAVVISDASIASLVSAKLLDFLGRPYAVGGHAITLGASLGIAVAGEHGDDALALLHAADLAMHQAELEGRNRVCRFLPSMQQTAQLRQALECDLRAAMGLQQIELRRALVSQQFEVHYQPQVSLSSGELTGFESLIRWRHPDRGLVSPDEFIPLAEEIGLVDLLGDWVLRTACREAMDWPVLPSGKRLRLAVNVSPLQLRDSRSFISSILRALDESSLPAECLEIEITETSLMGDVADTLSALRRLGVELALDDFGTGHSSLGRLQQYPFSRIKIDRSFVSALGNEGESGRVGEWMIRAIASLGAGLGIETIVEGIETIQQRDIARTAGCTEMQGYYVSRPLPTCAAKNFIENFNQAHAMETPRD